VVPLVKSINCGKVVFQLTVVVLQCFILDLHFRNFSLYLLGISKLLHQLLPQAHLWWLSRWYWYLIYCKKNIFCIGNESDARKILIIIQIVRNVITTYCNHKLFFTVQWSWLYIFKSCYIIHYFIKLNDLQ